MVGYGGASFSSDCLCFLNYVGSRPLAEGEDGGGGVEGRRRKKKV